MARPPARTRVTLHDISFRAWEHPVGEAFRQSQDMIGKLVHEASGVLGTVRGWLDDRFRRGGDDSAS